MRKIHLLTAFSLFSFLLAVFLYATGVIGNYSQLRMDSELAKTLALENASLALDVGKQNQVFDQLSSRIDKQIEITDKLNLVIGIVSVGAGGYSSNSVTLEEKLDLLEQRHKKLDAYSDLFKLVPIHFPILGDFQYASGFGARKSPFGGGVEVHRGIDLAAKRGVVIRAAGGGTVKMAGRWRKYGMASYGRLGLFLVIEHGDTNYWSIYGHCSKILVNEGDRVEAGQPIAHVGNTGWSTGPHLHFAIKQGERFVDPAAYLLNFDAEDLIESLMER